LKRFLNESILENSLSSGFIQTMWLPFGTSHQRKMANVNDQPTGLNSSQKPLLAHVVCDGKPMLKIWLGGILKRN
jgi:hypothetical protein